MTKKKPSKAAPKTKRKKKKQPTKKRKHAKKSATPKFRLFKFMFALGLWALIGVGLLTAWYAAELPDIIDSPKFERKAAITVYAADHSVITRYGEIKGISVTVAELPPHLVHAVLAIEDRRFYQHYGVDPLGIARAVAANLLKGRVAQGGSTITQQLAKNLFLSHERTLKRKIQEALLALWLERKLGKDDILSAYLNRVYLGSGTYGVEAAARTYFGKSARDVNLREAAILAGLLKAPSRYSPLNNPDLAASRADVVLSAMVDAGYITQAQAKGKTTPPAPVKAPRSRDNSGRYFADWVTARMNELTGTPEDDLDIETTLDPDIQHIAEDILTSALEANGAQKKVSQGAIIVLDRHGAIVAMVGGTHYGKSQFNRATQAKRPPGSAFKPVVFLTALEKGRSPASKIEDAPITSGQYKPENFNGEYHGMVTLKDALSLSLNTATVRLAQETGMGPIIKTAKKLGIESPVSRDLSSALGSSGTSLLEMTGAYAVFANEGQKIDLHAISSIKKLDGQPLYIHDAPSAKRLYDRALIRKLNNMLEDVVETGTGKRAALPDSDVAGKTGTSQDFRDAWFIGFTGDYIAGVWLGNDDNSPMNGVTGGTLPAQIWHDMMLEVDKKRGLAPLGSRSLVGDTENGFGRMLRRLLSAVPDE